MSCVALWKAILHSHKGTIFAVGFRCVVHTVGAANEVTNRNAADAVVTDEPCVSIGSVLC